ncbi:MAG: Na(+)-translocating NADH-quinone reductase subunit A [Acidobacteria bacterium]|nr:Na(+)-translocating NADH-quinone reductase subunit A [Acidobacteriota bacterium]
MGLHTIRKGLQLPIMGEPQQSIEPARLPRRVALLGDDYVGLRPTMHVAVGDSVLRGQLLFEDKQRPGVRFTAPGSGRVVAINRGERRAFRSLVIELSRDEQEGRGEAARFSAYTGRQPGELGGSDVRDLLVESGLWVALRSRPFGRVAAPETRPHAIFVTAIDTEPLTPDVDVVLQRAHGAFERGVAALARLTDGTVYVCTAPGSTVPVAQTERVRREEFAGIHPAGTAGLHIHLLAPVDRAKLVWHVGYQDVVAIGRLFESGELPVDRVVALAGPAHPRPRLVRTRLGAAIADLLGDDAVDPAARVVSGSVLSGRTASGEVDGFLGRYHRQVCVIDEGRKREFLGWLSAGASKFSASRAFLSALRPGHRFRFSTTTHGSRRAIVPIGLYESVLPMDLLPTPLLRALVMHDVERAEELGCLELDEEDLALCTFVCPSKIDYGASLRGVLNTLEAEG